jgi:Carboxypeptidase regulatory-like domain
MKPLAARLVIGVALLLAATTACNDDSLPPAAGYAAVSGTVVDSTTSAPVAGAVITIDTVLTATTDATGKFSIAKVPSGIADYSVQAKGYQTLAASTNIEPGKPFALNLTLAAQSAQPHS